MPEKLMYGIAEFTYWTRLPLRDPITTSAWLDFEELPEMEFETLEAAVEAMIERYADKIYIKEVYRGKETVICFIVDSDYNIAAALNYDKTVIYK